jgi:FMN phosphatase YigB (HAD superfamily)
MDLALILFDWGGTLASVDSQTASLERGAREVSRLLGLDGDPGCLAGLAGAVLEAEFRAAADPSHREADLVQTVAEWAGETVGLALSDTELAAVSEGIGRAWVGSLNVLPGAIETVRLFRESRVRAGLVSNCCLPPRYCLEELSRQGLAEFLDFAVFSSEVGYRKPAPAIYQAALRSAFPDGGVPDLSRVLFVGDSPALDVMAPAAMGMRTALVHRPAGVWPQLDYHRARPDFSIGSVAELPALLGVA